MKLRLFMSRLTLRDERAASRVAVLAAVALTFAVVCAVLAQAPMDKVLVVNSDGAVEKYNAAQQSFRESLGTPVKEINLAGLSDAAAERAIRAEAPTAIYSIGARASIAARRSG